MRDQMGHSQKWIKKKEKRSNWRGKTELFQVFFFSITRHVTRRSPVPEKRRKKKRPWESSQQFQMEVHEKNPSIRSRSVVQKKKKRDEK